MQRFKVHIFILAIFIFWSANAFAQYKNEADLIKKANALFEDDKFVEAFEAYQTLLSNHKDDPNYNFRFGVCLMFSDKRDKTKPIFYLEKAAADPKTDILVHYFLGLSYHQNYRFTDAKRQYEIYRDEARDKAIARYNIHRRIEECENGLKLLESIPHLYVIMNKEVKDYSFYRDYNMASSGGQIIVKPEELKTKLDKKDETDRLAFFLPKSNLLYFSSYGEKGKTGKDIYRSRLGPDGSWSKPENLGTVINTNFDEAFPYVSPDGMTIYFSSNGHNSMGGYDVFKSTFNPSTFSWSQVENVDFPINTPFDEIFFVPDTSGKFAYFSSDRSSISGLIRVYHIGMNTKAEENENLAQYFLDDRNTGEGVKRIKLIAELNQNIDVQQYEEISNSIDDKNLSENNNVIENPLIVGRIAKEKQIENARNQIDTAFEIYKGTKTKTVSIKRSKVILENLAKENENKAAQLAAKNNPDNKKLIERLEKSVEIAGDITTELDKQLKILESSSEYFINSAGKMQKQFAEDKYDSLNIENEKFKIVASRIDTMQNYAESVLNKQQTEVKTFREKASAKYALLKKVDDNIDKLSKERDEYKSEIAKLQTTEEKAEYEELIAAIDKKIEDQKNEKIKLNDDWIYARNVADSISDFYSQTDLLVNKFLESSGSEDFRNLLKNDVNTIENEVYALKATNLKLYSVDSVSDRKQNTELAVNNGTETNLNSNKSDSVSDRKQNAELAVSNGTETNLNSIKSDSVSDRKQNAELAANNGTETNLNSNKSDSVSDRKQNTELAVNNGTETNLSSNKSDSVSDQKQNTELTVNNGTETNLNSNKSDSVSDRKQNAELAVSNGTETNLNSNKSDSVSDRKQNTELAVNNGTETNLSSNKSDSVSDRKQNTELTVNNGAETNLNSNKSDSVSDRKQNAELAVSNGTETNLNSNKSDSVSDRKQNTELAVSNGTETNLNSNKSDSVSDRKQNTELAVSNGTETNLNSNKSDSVSDRKQNTELAVSNGTETNLNSNKSDSVSDRKQNAELAVNNGTETSLINEISQDSSEEISAETGSKTENNSTTSNIDSSSQTIKNQDKVNLAIQDTGIYFLKSSDEIIKKIGNQQDNLNLKNIWLNQELGQKIQIATNLKDSITIYSKKSKQNDLNNDEKNLNFRKMQEAENSLQIIANEVVAIKKLTESYGVELRNIDKQLNQKLEFRDSLEYHLVNGNLKNAENFAALISEQTKFKNETNISANLTQKIEENKSKIEKLEANLNEIGLVSDSLEQLKLNTNLQLTKEKIEEIDQKIAENSKIEQDINFQINALNKINNQIVAEQQFNRQAEKSYTLVDSGLLENEIEEIIIPEEILSIYTKSDEIERSSGSNTIEKTADFVDKFDIPEYKDEKQIIVANNVLVPHKEYIQQLENKEKELSKLYEQTNIQINQYLNLSKEQKLEANKIFEEEVKNKDVVVAASAIKNVNELNAASEQNVQKAIALALYRAQIESEIKSNKLLIENFDTNFVAMRNAIDEKNYNQVELISKNSKIENSKTQIETVKMANQAITEFTNPDIFKKQISILDKQISKSEKDLEKNERKAQSEYAKSYLSENKDDVITHKSNAQNFEAAAMLLRKELILTKNSKDSITNIYNQSLSLQKFGKEELMNIKSISTSDSSEISSVSTVTRSFSMEEIQDQIQELNNFKADTNRAIRDTLLIAKKYYDNKNADIIYYNDLELANLEKLLIKKQINLLDAQISTIKKQMILVENMNVRISQQNKIDALQKELDTLMAYNSKLDILISSLEKRQNSNADILTLSELELLYNLQMQAGIARQQSKDLKNLASGQSFFDKRKLIKKSEFYSKMAANLENESIIFADLINKNQFISQQTELSGVDSMGESAISVLIKQKIEEANKNLQKSTEYRFAAQSKSLNPDDKNTLISEAQSFEKIAFALQNEAIDLYKSFIDSTLLIAKAQQETQRIKDSTNAVLIAEQSQKQKSVDSDTVTVKTIEPVEKTELNPENISLKSLNAEELFSLNSLNLNKAQQDSLIILKTDVLGAKLDAEIPVNQRISYYNNQRPIPINKELPDGLVFKVQVAAFKNTVPNNAFRGITPLVAEMSPNSAWIRYMSGLFTDFENAAIARDKIRQIGFKDAFVVPYYNGQRISIIQARQMIEQNKVYTSEKLVVAAESSNQTIYKSETAVRPVITIAQTNIENTTSEILPGNFGDPEVFFTIQIGVYAKARTSAQLFALNDLFYDNLANGFFRYYSGKTDNYNNALTLRNQIRAKGINDAFIVAYRNGKRIPIAQAQQLVNTQNLNQLQNPVNKEEIEQVLQNKIDSVFVQKPLQNTYTVINFRIQLGAYKNDVPVEVVNEFLKIAQNGIERQKQNDVTIYLTGNFTTYDAAKLSHQQIVQSIPGAFIVAFGDGKKISIEEALKSIGK